MSSVEIRNICKSFEGKKILNNVSFSIQEGEMVTLLGPSGCGKSTTLKIIAGLISLDHGDIIFNKKSIVNTPVEKRKAVIVFQENLLFPHMNVKENIGFGLKMAKVKKEIISDKVKEMINLVYLNGCENKYPHELSGGQKQRVSIARALAIEPKVLLLDEPFSNLDIRLRETLREFICSIQRKLNITTLLVTHDKEEALMISDKIAVMINGEIKQFASPIDVYKNPISIDVADFFGEKNYIIGHIKNGEFRSFFKSYKTSFSKFSSVKAMIKPEDVRIYNKNEYKGVKGVIIERKYAGDRIYYAALYNNLKIKVVTSSNILFNIGDEVNIDIDFNNAVFFENK